MAAGFYAEASERGGDFRRLMASVARFFGWSKSEVEDLTVEELYEWADHAAALAKAGNNGRR